MSIQAAGERKIAAPDAAARPLRVLVVAYRFPPQGGAGVQRPTKMVKAWARQGLGVTVLAGPGGLATLEDPTLLDDVPDSVQRVTAADPSPWIVSLKIRRSLSGNVVSRTLGRAVGAVGALVRKVSLPDGLNGWILTAVSKGMRMAREARPDVVVVTGPPFTPFVAGAILASRLDVPLVLDYRDPWTGTYLPNSATETRLARAVNPRIERWVLGRASGVIAAHRAIFRMLEPLWPERRPARLWVPNGYDPEDFDDDVSRGRDVFTLTYTGGFYSFRSPRVLLAALDELLREGRLAADDFRLRVAGDTERIRRACPDGPLHGALRLEGYVPHRRSVRHLQESTVNLVMEGDIGGPNRHSPGKFYEVLFAGRPMLLLCPEGVTTRLARRAGACRIAHPENKQAIREAVCDLYDAWRRGELGDGPSRQSIRFYDRFHQAARVRTFLDRVVETRRGEREHVAT
jgi:hypothetical protein